MISFVGRTKQEKFVFIHRIEVISNISLYKEQGEWDAKRRISFFFF
jgi:hypothetical protein